MRKLFVSTVVAIIASLATASFAEDLPPITLGAGQTTTQHANGQTIEISIVGSVQVTVYFENIEPQLLQGLVVRTSGGTTSGSVTIRWINTNESVVLNITPSNTTQAFSLEGGDGDKRAPDEHLK